MRFSQHSVFRFGILMISLVVLLLGGLTSVSSSPTAPNANYFVYLPLITKPCPSVTFPSSSNWLAYLNYYRATACLPPVTENPVWSDGDHKHAIYIVKNDVLQHDEDPNNLWYTPEGKTAAQQSNLAGSYDVNLNNQDIVRRFQARR